MNKKHLTTLFFILILICVLFTLYKILSSNIKDKTNESFTNYQSIESINNQEITSELIKYGNFEQKQHILNSQVGSGHNIISYPNPGNSSYVLQQSTLINNCPNKNVEYKIKLSLNKKKFYRLRSWVCLSDDWNGTNYIFTLKIFNQDNYRLVKAEGQIIENIKIYNVHWTLYEYILEFKSYDTGEINWYLGYHPNNTVGYRYFTGISITLFNPMLNDFQVINGLKCFLNVNNRLSFNNASLTWKDISNNGRDFEFSTLPVINDQYSINILNNMIVGPYCNSLGINNKQNITILWYAKFSQILQNEYKQSNKDSCFYQLFNIYTDCPRFPYLTVSYNNYDNCLYISCKNIKYKGIYIGISHSRSLYILTINGNRLFLQKDDTLLDSPDIVLYDLSSNNNSFNANKAFVLNPNKNLNMDLSAFLIYNRLISSQEINQIRSYLLNQQTNKTDKIINNTYNINSDKVLEKKMNNKDNYINERNNYSQDEFYEQDDYVYPYEVVNNSDDYYTDKNILLTTDECKDEDNNNHKEKKCPNVFSDRSWNFNSFNSGKNKTSKQLNKGNKNKDDLIEGFTSIKKSNYDEKDYSNEQPKKNLVSNEENYNDSVDEVKQEDINNTKIQKDEKNIISEEEVFNKLDNDSYSSKISSDLENTTSSYTLDQEVNKINSSTSLINKVKQKNKELNDPDYEQPTYFEINNINSFDFDTQMINNIINSNQYIDQSIKSDYRQTLFNIIGQFNKTNNIQEKESLILKIKLLNQLVLKDEQEIKANPNQKKNNLIDAQGNLINRASYGTSSDENNLIFNRILYTDPKECPKDIDLSKYIKKSDVDANYISKKTVYQDYVKKDEIPCWGCNLKD